MIRQPVSAPKPAPIPAPPAPVQTAVNIEWNTGGLIGGHARKVIATYVAAPDGSPDPTSVISYDNNSFGWMKGDLRNPTQQAIARVFVQRVAAEDVALRLLTPNAPKAVRIGGGEFQLVLDRPGTEPDLIYAGLLKAVPQPIANIIAGAKELQRHL